MLTTQLSTLQIIAVAILPVLLAVIIHEVAHGWVAYRLGDDTAYMMGRLTLNPLKHIDPIGTILVPLVLILTAGVAFGWAKPVPINFRKLHKPKRDTALVAVAGPAANLLMAIIWLLLAKIATLLPDGLSALAVPLTYMSTFGVLINSILMVFNLIPIPPTDGGRIMTSLLPVRIAYPLSKVEPYGLIIILILLLTGVIWQLLDVVIQFVMYILSAVL
jgi:Zn-dependent protease